MNNNFENKLDFTERPLVDFGNPKQLFKFTEDPEIRFELQRQIRFNKILAEEKKAKKEAEMKKQESKSIVALESTQKKFVTQKSKRPDLKKMSLVSIVATIVKDMER